MGFTPFPYDISTTAVEDSYRFLGENGDLIAQHMESVPWTEAAEGTEFSRDLRNNWKGRKEGTRKGMKTYLALSPGRGDPALYWGEKENMPLPAGFRGAKLGDPAVTKAYIAYCLRAVEYFQPDYLAIGIEVNEIYLNKPAAWPGYLAIHRAVYKAVKARYPGLPVFASFTLHVMLDKGKSKEKRKGMLAAMRELMPWNDVVAASFYPFAGGLSGDSDRAFKWLARKFDRYRKPYAVAETGEPAESLRIPWTIWRVKGTPEGQAAYYESLLAFAARKRLIFVVSFLHRDYDALWEKIRKSSPGFFIVWRDCGLLDERGNPRPACRIWRRWHEVPLAGPVAENAP